MSLDYRTRVNDPTLLFVIVCFILFLLCDQNITLQSHYDIGHSWLFHNVQSGAIHKWSARRSVIREWFREIFIGHIVKYQSVVRFHPCHVVYYKSTVEQKNNTCNCRCCSFCSLANGRRMDKELHILRGCNAGHQKSLQIWEGFKLLFWALSFNVLQSQESWLSNYYTQFFLDRQSWTAGLVLFWNSI